MKKLLITRNLQKKYAGERWKLESIGGSLPPELVERIYLETPDSRIQKWFFGERKIPVHGKIEPVEEYILVEVSPDQDHLYFMHLRRLK